MRKRRENMIPEGMEREKVLSGILACDKLISVNRRLGRAKNGRMHLSPEYAREEVQLWQSMENSGLVQGCLDNSCFYAVSLVYFLQDNFVKRDQDNLAKPVIDCLSKYLGFNDNRLVSHKSCKRMITDTPEDQPKFEYVYFELEKVYKRKEDYTIPFSDFKEFVRKRTGHDIFDKLSNKLRRGN